MSLSSALCRPTSSRAATQLAVGREARRRVQPAGLVEHALVLARAGRAASRTHARRDASGPAPTGAQRTSTSSSAALPQIPHDEFAR